MKFLTKYKRPQFNYTPMYLKEPKKDLRERMRIPRDPDRHRGARPWWHYLLLLMFFLFCYWRLFPEITGNLLIPDIVIDSTDEVYNSNLHEKTVE
jgi:hypothetical protein